VHKVGKGLDRERELRKTRRLMAVFSVASLVATFGPLLYFGAFFTPWSAISVASLAGLPFLIVVWRLDGRYNDLLFRDDLE
jgi:hypothetical protein